MIDLKSMLRASTSAFVGAALILTVGGEIGTPAIGDDVAEQAPASSPAGQGKESRLGLFETHGDIGTVLHPGAAEYDAVEKRFTVAGSGENMWSTVDAFQFAWTKTSGDLALAADVSFLGAGATRTARPV